MKPKRPQMPPLPYSRYDNHLKFKNDIDRNDWLSFIHKGETEPLDFPVSEKVTKTNYKLLLIS